MGGAAVDSNVPSPGERRAALSWSSRVAMLIGLAGGYGALALVAARFLYPARAVATRRMFVTRVGDLPVGETRLYRTPEGRTVNVTRIGTGATVSDFIALSSVCPHLGCQVHWEAQNARYYCPCHNGTFDADGTATGGPPGDAGLALPRYALSVTEGLLFIEVPVEELALEPDGRAVRHGAVGISAPGHDRCLAGWRERGGTVASGRRRA